MFQKVICLIVILINGRYCYDHGEHNVYMDNQGYGFRMKVNHHMPEIKYATPPKEPLQVVHSFHEPTAINYLPQHSQHHDSKHYDHPQPYARHPMCYPKEAHNANFDSMKGLWYLIEVTPAIRRPFRCTFFMLKQQAKDTIKFFSRNYNEFTGVNEIVRGVLTQNHGETWISAANNRINVYNATILAADYDKFVMLHLCDLGPPNPIGPENTPVVIEIMSRKPYLDYETRAHLHQILRQQYIDDDLYYVSQQNCVYKDPKTYIFNDTV